MLMAVFVKFIGKIVGLNKKYLEALEAYSS